jgi:hypothetical protein
MDYRGTVTEIIADLILENDLHPNDKLKLSSLAINGLRELNNDTLPTIKTERFEIPPSRVIKLPNDYIDWCKVAVQYKEGLRMLAMNFQMAQGVSEENVPSIYASNMMAVGQPSYYLYGYGYGYMPYGGGGGRVQAFGNGGNLGDFSIDEKNRLLKISVNVTLSNIYLEYISDCMAPNDETCVHPYCIAWIKAFTLTEFYKRRKDPAWQIFSADEMVERRLMRRRFMTLSPATIVNIVEQQWGSQE